MPGLRWTGWIQSSRPRGWRAMRSARNGRVVSSATNGSEGGSGGQPGPGGAGQRETGQKEGGKAGKNRREIGRTREGRHCPTGDCRRRRLGDNHFPDDSCQRQKPGRKPFLTGHRHFIGTSVPNPSVEAAIPPFRRRAATDGRPAGTRPHARPLPDTAARHCPPVAADCPGRRLPLRPSPPSRPPAAPLRARGGRAHRRAARSPRHRRSHRRPPPPRLRHRHPRPCLRSRRPGGPGPRNGATHRPGRA